MMLLPGRHVHLGLGDLWVTGISVGPAGAQMVGRLCLNGITCLDAVKGPFTPHPGSTGLGIILCSCFCFPRSPFCQQQLLLGVCGMTLPFLGI